MLHKFNPSKYFVWMWYSLDSNTLPYGRCASSKNINHNQPTAAKSNTAYQLNKHLYSATA